MQRAPSPKGRNEPGQGISKGTWAAGEPGTKGCAGAGICGAGVKGEVAQLLRQGRLCLAGDEAKGEQQ